MFHMVFVQITESEGNKKGEFLKKISKIISGTIRWIKCYFYTFLWHYPLHKLCFCFGLVRTLVLMAIFYCCGNTWTKVR